MLSDEQEQGRSQRAAIDIKYSARCRAFYFRPILGGMTQRLELLFVMMTVLPVVMSACSQFLGRSDLRDRAVPLTCDQLSSSETCEAHYMTPTGNAEIAGQRLCVWTGVAPFTVTSGTCSAAPVDHFPAHPPSADGRPNACPCFATFRRTQSQPHGGGRSKPSMQTGPGVRGCPQARASDSALRRQ